MSQAEIDNLDLLQPNSGQHLSGVAIASSIPTNGIKLCSPKMLANANWTVVMKNGASISQSVNLQYQNKLTTISPMFESNEINILNTALLGGKSYPVLSAVLGTAAGIASFGAGLIFSAAMAGLSLSQTSQRVLVRSGDEIWQIENIGKELDDNLFGSSKYKAVHVLSYFLVDPYRRQALRKGWLIHEKRTDITLDLP